MLVFGNGWLRELVFNSPCLGAYIRITTTKNTGTQNTASTVAVIIPPITPVPSACWLFALAPFAITSGTTPRMNASDVIKIGRKRRCAASTVASMRGLPCAAVPWRTR